VSEEPTDLVESEERPPETRLSRLRLVPRVIGWIVLVVALVDGLSWAFDWTSIQQPGEAWAAMRPISALCFGLLALGLLGEANGRQRQRWTLRTLDAAVVAIAALVVYGYVRDEAVIDARMSSGTAIMLLLLSTAAARGMTKRLGQILVAVAAVPAYLAFVGFAIDVDRLADIEPIGSVSLQAAACALLLAIGGLFADETTWMRRVGSGRDPAHVLLRRFVPVSLALLPSLAFVGRLGVDESWWSPASATLVGSLGGSVVLFALVLGVARKLVRMQAERLEADEAAERDPLTGVGNRRCLERLLARVFHDPDQRPMCALLAIDLDDFKSINDLLGMDGGDRALREFAGFLRDRMRPGDVVVRTGGDEFAVFLPAILPTDVMTVARNITTGVSEWRDDRQARPSASIGVAVMDNDVENALDLIKRADHALLRAKQTGKAVAVQYRPAIKLPSTARPTASPPGDGAPANDEPADDELALRGR